MKTTWILVANRSTARIFDVDSPAAQLTEVFRLDHPEGRTHKADTKSDSPGETFDSAGSGRHAMSSSVEPAEQEAIRFAKEIGTALLKEKQNGRFEKLYVVADGHFRGALREQWEHLGHIEIVEIDKNLGGLSSHEIRSHLPERL